jgi:hypothetical protein
MLFLTSLAACALVIPQALATLTSSQLSAAFPGASNGSLSGSTKNVNNLAVTVITNSSELPFLARAFPKIADGCLLSSSSRSLARQLDERGCRRDWLVGDWSRFRESFEEPRVTSLMLTILRAFDRKCPTRITSWPGR